MTATEMLKNPSWSSEDPRHVFGKVDSVRIIVWTGDRATGGFVHTHHGDYVELDEGLALDRKHSPELIASDESWPEGWLWTLAPGVGAYDQLQPL